MKRVLRTRSREVTKRAFDAAVSAAARLHDATGFGRRRDSAVDAILCYHGVGEPEESGWFGTVSPERFRGDVASLAAHYELVDLETLATGTADDGAGAGRIALTFDDGHRSVVESALPILREFDVPATVFVNPALLGDRDRELVARRHGVDCDGRMLFTDEEVRELVADPLITVGNHTRTHPNLTDLDSPAARRTEIVGAKEHLEERFGIDVTAFSYPHGAFDPAARRVVEASHEISVTTEPFLVDPSTGSHRLPRISAHESRERLLWNLTPASDALNAVRYSR